MDYFETLQVDIYYYVALRSFWTISLTYLSTFFHGQTFNEADPLQRSYEQQLPAMFEVLRFFSYQRYRLHQFLMYWSRRLMMFVS